MKLDTLCAADIILDTNVLSHAHNVDDVRHGSALAVMDWIRNSSVMWILDNQGKSAPNPSTSVLYSEYHSTLPPQSFALILLAALLASGRVGFAARPEQADRNKIRKLVPCNSNDQAILGAAIGCTDRLLVSNDEDDFPESVRDEAERIWNVAILLSDEVV